MAIPVHLGLACNRALMDLQRIHSRQLWQFCQSQQRSVERHSRFTGALDEVFANHDITQGHAKCSSALAGGEQHTILEREPCGGLQNRLGCLGDGDAGSALRRACGIIIGQAGGGEFQHIIKAGAKPAMNLEGWNCAIKMVGQVATGAFVEVNLAFNQTLI